MNVVQEVLNDIAVYFSGSPLDAHNVCRYVLYHCVIDRLATCPGFTSAFALDLDPAPCDPVIVKGYWIDK